MQNGRGERVTKTVKIGVGTGWAGDRIDAGKILVERVDLDFLMIEAMSESTVSSARERMLADPNDKGFDPLLVERMRSVLPACHAKGIKIVSNQGWANPEAARERVAALAKETSTTPRFVERCLEEYRAAVGRVFKSDV